jgi:signal transduction histidine kinase
MDKNIQEKTSELSDKVSELQRSKSAILNLLEDIEDEKKKVEGLVVERTGELNLEKARLLASINSIPFGFVVAGVDNKILLTNQVMVQMFKLEQNKEIYLDDIGKNIGGSFNLKSEVEWCIKGKAVCEIKEIVFDQKIFRGIVAPIVSKEIEKNVVGYVFMLEDVTEAKSMERSRDEFFSIASHELRTPLTAIRGNSEMLRDNYKDKMADKDMEEMIDDIHNSSIRLIDIVNDFLEVSRLEQGRIEIKKEKFKTGEVINKVIKDMTEMTKQKGLEIVYKPSKPDEPAVDSDKYRVEQILFNLLGNAVKFTAKGVITFTTEQIGDFIKTSVTDNGLGISEANQALLFRKFQQASENVLARDVTQGTGLGLYICRLIAGKLGGTIGLEKSELGKGSTFAFTLPLAK